MIATTSWMLDLLGYYSCVSSHFAALSVTCFDNQPGLLFSKNVGGAQSFDHQSPVTCLILCSLLCKRNNAEQPIRKFGWHSCKTGLIAFVRLYTFCNLCFAFDGQLLFENVALKSGGCCSIVNDLPAGLKRSQPETCKVDFVKHQSSTLNPNCWSKHVCLQNQMVVQFLMWDARSSCLWLALNFTVHSTNHRWYTIIARLGQVRHDL